MLLRCQDAEDWFVEDRGEGGGEGKHGKEGGRGRGGGRGPNMLS